LPNTFCPDDYREPTDHSNNTHVQEYTIDKSHMKTLFILAVSKYILPGIQILIVAAPTAYFCWA
jgi:hypothetical protein